MAKSKAGTKTEPMLPGPHLNLDEGKKTAITAPTVARIVEQLIAAPPTPSSSESAARENDAAREKGLASIGLDHAPGKYTYDPTAILSKLSGPLLGVQGREVAKKLDQAFKHAITPKIATVTPGTGGWQDAEYTDVRGALTEAAQAKAFGHTPSGYWSQTDDKGVMGGGLTDEQITDIESQIDTFDEIGGAGGIGQSEDGQEWGE